MIWLIILVIYVNVLFAFAIKNCDQVKFQKKLNFENDDLEILNKYKENLDKIRSEIDNQNINYYIDYIVNSII